MIFRILPKSNKRCLESPVIVKSESRVLRRSFQARFYHGLAEELVQIRDQVGYLSKQIMRYFLRFPNMEKDDSRVSRTSYAEDDRLWSSPAAGKDIVPFPWTLPELSLGCHIADAKERTLKECFDIRMRIYCIHQNQPKRRTLIPSDSDDKCRCHQPSKKMHGETT